MKKPVDTRLMSIMRRSAAVGAAEAGAAASKPRISVRRAARSAKFKYAIVHYGNGGAVACVAINLDQFGARLRFSGETFPPKQVLIAIPEIGLRRRATLRWRKGCEAGFEFLSDADQPDGPVKTMRRPRVAAPC